MLFIAQICKYVVGIVLYHTYVHGCGPAVHNEVAERSRQWFYKQPGTIDSDRISVYRDILDRHPETLQAGTVFPDWGYGCMSMDDEAEAAHWTPFLEHGLRYLHAKYPFPFTSAKAEQLVAFLFGIAAHQVSDEQWHSLSGMHEGIMRVLADSTFQGDFARAHDVLDVGGDFALAHMNDLKYMLDKWTVPIDDVLGIYKEMGYSVSRWRMNICITRQFYAMEAVKRFGKGLFPSYASRAPMLTESLDSYYLGGLNAMATGTNTCWHLLIDWFDNRNFTNKCLVSDRSQHRHQSSTNRQRSLLEAMDLPKQHIQQIRQTVSVSEHEGRLHLTATTPGASNLSGVNRQHTFASNKPAKSETVGECANLQILFPKIKQLYSTSAYSGLGTAVVSGDFSGSGRASVAISAPYFIPAIYDNRHSNGKLAAGAVFVLSDADPVYNFSQQDILDTYPQVIRPPVDSAMRFPLFGSSMAVVDFNADGVDDLAVGSSGFGEHPESSMLGRVDIYLGQQNVGLSSRPNFTLTAEQLARFTHSQKHRIGGHLFGEDVNQDGFVDLIIGAPYDSEQRNKRHSGNVYGYMARSYRQPGVLGAPDFTLNSPSPNAFEWFGQTARAVKLANSTLLLVGAPGHRETDATGQTHPLVGRIYAFNVGNSTIPLFGGLEFATTKDNTQLGSQMYVWDSSTGGNPLVLFGSPSEHNSVLGQAVYVPDKPVPERGWQAGEVRVIDPTQWAYGSGSSKQKSLDEMSGLLDTLRGMQSPGHFGRALATTLESLWIGEPFSDMEDGRVYRWKRGTKLPTCYAIPGMRQARFGHSISVVDAGDKQIVLVTAPHDSQFSRFSGSISILSSDET